MEENEKKVEYIELIYDLIFVYIIGRNNSLLHHVENGFVKPGVFVTYILSTLVVLQIWYYTTLFVNRYGENNRTLYIGIFINMYLLYYMADGTRVQWQNFYTRYNVAWCLILLNLTFLYYKKYRENSKIMPWENTQIKFNMLVLLIQAALILISLPLYYLTDFPFAPIAMGFGIMMAIFGQKINSLVSVDFAHLTERVMLYVVFTFGEMIIGISGYFEGSINITSIYFSLCAFLIVAGLFMSYGFVYDHIIDRELKTNGTGYMMIHIFLITALNNITIALEFMREGEVDAIPKNIFLVASFLVYFIFLFLTEQYAIVRCKGNRRFFGKLILCSFVFLILMVIFYQNSFVSIAVSVVYVYIIYLLIYIYWIKINKKKKENNA